jgi:hypothetical protein
LASVPTHGLDGGREGHGEAESGPVRDVIKIDKAQLLRHLDRLIRDSVEQTLNGLVDAAADRLCNGSAVADEQRAQAYHPEQQPGPNWLPGTVCSCIVFPARRDKRR